MKKFFEKIEEMLANMALFEEDADNRAASPMRWKSFAAALEEHLVEIAFAEAADYDEIHAAILREHDTAGGQVHPDDCQYGDNDICFVTA